jgi:hypothetical protein
VLAARRVLAVKGFALYRLDPRAIDVIAQNFAHEIPPKLLESIGRSVVSTVERVYPAI